MAPLVNPAFWRGRRVFLTGHTGFKGSWLTVWLEHLGAVEIPGRGRLDVRENVCFRGRHLAQSVHDRYPETACALAIEVKKFFMDEHRGEINGPLSTAVGEALAATVPGMVDELDRVSR